MLRWKGNLDNGGVLGSWDPATLPCDPATLSSGWQGVTCRNVTAEGQERPAPAVTQM